VAVVFLVLCVAIAGLSGCASKDSGTLLIIGGGLRDDNAEIYSRFITLAGPHATIGVVPTASGVENPGSETMATLRKYARPDQAVILIPLFKDDAAPAADGSRKADQHTIAALIRSCRALWFTGGDQSRITAVFRPEPSRTSLAYAATLDVLNAGGVIAGTSAGAAMMSDPMITGGTSEAALKHGAVFSNDPGPDEGVGLTPGMGYLNSVLRTRRPGMILVDQHFTERDRFARLWVAMTHLGSPTGFGIPENTAVEFNRRTGIPRALGPGKVIMMSPMPPRAAG
jgi:cyanophycinase